MVKWSEVHSISQLLTTRTLRTENPELSFEVRFVCQQLPVHYLTTTTVLKSNVTVPADFVWEPADRVTLQGVLLSTINEEFGP